jgi:hypothetical protein
MPNQTCSVAPVRDLGLADLCRKLTKKLSHPWELKQLPFGFLLVIYFDSGVGDHPLRDAGGNEGGKCTLNWYERNHEVLGIGKTPQDASRAVLLDGKGARLRAMQIAGIEDRRMHLVFRNLDTKEIVWPDRLLVASGPLC